MSTGISSYTESLEKTDWNVSDDEEDIEDVDTKLTELSNEGACQHATAPDGPKILEKIIQKGKELFEKIPMTQSAGNSNNHVNLKSFYGPNSKDEYEKKNGGRRLMLVIQNEKFQTMDNRIGCTADKKALKKTFKKRGFMVKCFKNLGASQIAKKLEEASKAFNHGEADCFACVISSHGGEFYTSKGERKDMIYGYDESSISVEQIMKYFDDQHCPALQSKPRLFFIQACRGKDSDAGENIQLLGKISSQRKIITQKTQVDVVGETSSEAIDDQEISISDSQPTLPVAVVDEEDRVERGQGRTSGTEPVSEEDAAVETSPEAIDDQEISISDSQPTLPVAVVNEEDMVERGQGRTSGTEPVPEEDAAVETSGTEPVPEEDAAVETSGTGPVPEDMDIQLIMIPSPCYTDSLIMFSSPPGHVSYIMESGSWFIQSLCAEFNKYSINKPFVHYLTNTCRRIAFDFKSNCSIYKHKKYHNKVVVPCIYSCLTKDLKLKELNHNSI